MLKLPNVLISLAAPRQRFGRRDFRAADFQASW